MAIADTPIEALLLTTLWTTSLFVFFIIGVLLEHKRMKKRYEVKE